MENEGTKCHACRAEGSVVTPSRAWWLVIGAAWAVILLLGVCCAVPVPFSLVLVPSWLALASSLGPLATELVDPKCRACGAVVRRGALAERAAPVVAETAPERPSAPVSGVPARLRVD